jgi:hypothetical protein
MPRDAPSDLYLIAGFNHSFFHQCPWLCKPGAEEETGSFVVLVVARARVFVDLRDVMLREICDCGGLWALGAAVCASRATESA